jgi:hypothetical protein
VALVLRDAVSAGNGVSIQTREIEFMRLLSSKVIVFALVAVVFGALTAVANADGNGTVTEQFKAAYTDAWGLQNTCSGVHQVKKDGSVYDIETCVVTGGLTTQWVAGKYSSNIIPGNGCGAIAPAPPGYPASGIVLYSDYPGLNGQCAVSWNMILTPHGDGRWTIHYKASY